MKLSPVVLRAATHVAEFRRRLYEVDLAWSNSEAVELSLLCDPYLGCPIVAIDGLSDRAALAYLEEHHGIDTTGETADAAPLAGGLYLARSGFPRWIFVERRDTPERQRFSIAHEVGHLVRQAEPALALEKGAAGNFFDEASSGAITRFSRCAYTAMEVTEDQRMYRSAPQPGPRPVWTEAALLEIEANHFAAELLMPLEGVRRLIALETGVRGIQSERDLEQLVSRIARTYQVSYAAARRRLVKDLAVVPVSCDANTDLFG